MSKPYTYLIGWSKQNLWYYGVRYSKRCSPDDLWVTYFTSSKRVKQLRRSIGEPDIKQVRKVFNTAEDAKRWEDKVLVRINARHTAKWINLCQPNSFRGAIGSWNTGLTKNTCELLKEIGAKISKSRQGVSIVQIHKPKTPKQIISNRWDQIIKHKPNFPFKTYDQFKQNVIDLYNQRLGVYTIARRLDVDGSTIKTILGSISSNQSWSKIIKNLPDFPFNSYEEFCNHCYTQVIINKRRVYHLTKELGVSFSTIKKAISSSHMICL